MTAKTLMIQGTASSAGKSILVTALCRILRQDGFRVAPFKSQNMALNSFVTSGGDEIGRAQAVQAEAAGIAPSVYMNPVLLKPEANSRCQMIVMGKVMQTLRSDLYYDYTPYLLRVIEDSLARLRTENDVIVIEGAGSPAEINLKEREIVNMRIARMAAAPVLLVGDIDRGGVFASLVGTLELLDPDEREFVKGFIINKFRGDVELLKPGLDMLESRTRKPVFGVIPYFRDINIAQEDSVYLDERINQPVGQGLNVAVIRLPHISNYDDFDPLEESGCTVRYITACSEIEKAELIIIPGTKSTISDLLYLKEHGLAEAILRQARAGVPVIGICGGYQMLGRLIRDPHEVESNNGEVEGLGLLDMETIFKKDKTITQVKARVVFNDGLLAGMKGMEVTGYEIHMGQSGPVNSRPVFEVMGTPAGEAGYFDGAVSADSRVFGSYLHGLLHNAAFTKSLLDRIRQYHGLPPFQIARLDKEKQYNALADLVRHNLNMQEVYNLLK